MHQNNLEYDTGFYRGENIHHGSRLTNYSKYSRKKGRGTPQGNHNTPKWWPCMLSGYINTVIVHKWHKTVYICPLIASRRTLLTCPVGWFSHIFEKWAWHIQGGAETLGSIVIRKLYHMLTYYHTLIADWHCSLPKNRVWNFTSLRKSRTKYIDKNGIF